MLEWKIPDSMEKVIGQVADKLQGEDKLIQMFRKCYANTLNTTVRRHDDGTTYIITYK